MRGNYRKGYDAVLKRVIVNMDGEFCAWLFLVMRDR